MKSPASRNGKRVAVTGWSALAGGTTSAGELWQRLCSHRSYVGEGSNSDEQLASTAQLAPADASILARHQLLALSAVESAWCMAGLPRERNRLRGKGARVHRPDFGCVAGMSLSGLSAMVRETATGKPSAYSLSRWRGNSISSAVALRFGLGGADFSLNSASATGSQAFFLAGSLVASGVFDAVAVVVAESELPPVLSEAAFRNGSVTRDVSHGPLSPGRSGMRPSEGAAAVILESESHVVCRQGEVRAWWIGGSCANEAAHLVAAEEGGEVLRRLLRGSRDLADSRQHSLDWISLHATGTRQFDAIEVAAVRHVFTDRLPWITAMKRVFGHALGASGLIEAALVLEGLSRGCVPPWPCALDPALELPVEGPRDAILIPDAALLIGQGMGGTVVTNVLASVRT